MELPEYIAQVLEPIDAGFSEAEVPLKRRPLRAAIIFINDLVLEIRGDTKEDFETKPWFKVLYHHIDEWYRERYGPAFDNEATNIALGVTLVRKLPVELRIPLTRTKAEVSGQTVWLSFPIVVEDDEDVLSWLVDPPTLDKLSPNELSDLKQRIVKVATSLRIIRINMEGVSPSDAKVSGFLQGVLVEIENAARNLLRSDTSGRGTALWSLQMAAERALKAFSQHTRGTYTETHDLFRLFDEISIPNGNVERDLLKALPRQDSVIEGRYGMGHMPTLLEVMAAYDATIAIVSGILPLFKRRIHVGGTKILINRAPWLSPPSENSL